LKISLIRSYSLKLAGIQAVPTKNQGLSRKGGSNGWDEDDTLLILAIKGREYAPITSRPASINIGFQGWKRKGAIFQAGHELGIARGWYCAPIHGTVFLEKFYVSKIFMPD